MYLHKHSNGKIQKIEFFKIYKRNKQIANFLNFYYKKKEIKLNDLKNKKYAFRNFFKPTKNKKEYFCITFKRWRYTLMARLYSIKFKKLKNTPRNIILTPEEEESGYWEDLKLEITYCTNKKNIVNSTLENTIKEEFLELKNMLELEELPAHERCLNTDFQKNWRTAKTVLKDSLEPEIMPFARYLERYILLYIFINIFNYNIIKYLYINKSYKNLYNNIIQLLKNKRIIPPQSLFRYFNIIL